MKELLRVENLKKYYGETHAVDGVSFTVNTGEIVAFLGPNGAGKSTTIDTIVGLHQKNEGTIAYFGQPRVVISRADKERIGVQLQNTVFFPELTVREILVLFQSLYKRRLPLEQVFSYFSLEEQANKRIKQLSGGQKQRLALACALINDPDLILFDEPTAGLDAQNRQWLWTIIRNLRKTGKGIILTTHYMEEAENLADRIILIDHGVVVASGRLDELMQKYGHGSLEELFLALTGNALRD